MLLNPSFKDEHNFVEVLDKWFVWDKVPERMSGGRPHFEIVDGVLKVKFSMATPQTEEI